MKDNAKTRASREPKMKLSQAVVKVIDLARRIREYWEVELPKRHPNYPLMNPEDQPVPTPPEEKKLAKLFGGLPEELVYQIGLLMFLGRGDFPVGELADAYKRVKENFANPASLAPLLTNKVSLADYLQHGLAELEKHQMDLDNLPLEPTKTRK